MPKSRAFSLCFALLTSSCFTAGYASGPLVNGKISKNANDDVLIKESLVDEKVTKDGAPPRKEGDLMIDTASNDVPLMPSSSNGNSVKKVPLRSNDDTSGKDLPLKSSRAKVVSLRSRPNGDDRKNLQNEAQRNFRQEQNNGGGKKGAANFIHGDKIGIMVTALSLLLRSFIKMF